MQNDTDIAKLEDSPSKAFATTLSYVILARIGIHCLIQIKDRRPLFSPHLGYTVLTVNSFVGIFRWGTPFGDRFEKIYDSTTYTQTLLLLPCITTAVWLGNGYNEIVSWSWVVFPIFPFVAYYIDMELDRSVVSFLTILNLSALAEGTLSYSNYIGTAATVVYALAEFCETNLFWYNLGMTCFGYMSLKAIGF